MVPFPDFVNNLVAHENHRPIFSQPIKNSIKKLIESCWSNNSEERPNFKEIFNKKQNLIFWDDFHNLHNLYSNLLHNKIFLNIN